MNSSKYQLLWLTWSLFSFCFTRCCVFVCYRFCRWIKIYIYILIFWLFARRPCWQIHSVKWRHGNLWSPHDRHFVGILWQNVWSSGGEDLPFRSNGIKSVGKKMSLTYQRNVFKWYCSKGGNVTSAGWQVTLCDPIWHVSSRSGVAG